MRRRKQKKAVLTLAIMSFMLIVAVGVLAESVRAGKEEKEAFLVPFLFREIVYEMQPVYAYLTRGGGVSSPLSDYVWDYSDADKIKEFHLELLKKENEVVAHTAVRSLSSENGHRWILCKIRFKGFKRIELSASDV